MSDLTRVHPFERGRQAKGTTPTLLLLPVWRAGPHDENASSEREAELRWEADASPAPVLQGPASASPHPQLLQHPKSEGNYVLFTMKHNPWHFLTQPGGSLTLPSLFHFLPTQTIPLQELVKNYWTEFRFFFSWWLSVLLESKPLKSIRRWVSGNQVFPDQKILVSMRGGWDGEGKQINFHSWSDTIKTNMFPHVFLQISKQH